MILTGYMKKDNVPCKNRTPEKIKIYNNDPFSIKLPNTV